VKSTSKEGYFDQSGLIYQVPYWVKFTNIIVHHSKCWKGIIVMKTFGTLIFTVLLLLLFSTTALAVSTDQEPVCEETYRIVRGDWLSKIANRCGVSVQDLLQANPQITNPSRIYVGQTIEIPVWKEPTVRITPDTGLPGTEINLIIRGFSPNKMVEYTFGNNGEIFTASGEIETNEKGSANIKLTIPEDAEEGETWVAQVVPHDVEPLLYESGPFTVREGPEIYVVKRGDRLSRIAASYNTSIAAFLDLNDNIKNPNIIHVGQRLTVPPEGFEPSDEAKQRARLAPPAPSKPSNVNVGHSERWIDVILSTQTLHAYEGDRLVRSFVVSTGLPRTPTLVGQWRIYIKLTKTDMRGPGYHLRDVPYTMYYYRGYGIHGTYWHNNFGTPMSAGCVNLTIDDAKWLYNFASVGTLVNVRR
jgi:lipoprotein-anchoring transpeptidase ErfK/SrfK